MDGTIVVEASGVGYQLAVSQSTRQALQVAFEVGREETVLAKLVGRDDGLYLYGFATAEERDLFELLTSVQGVGPKAALGMLALPPEDLMAAIRAGDADTLKGIKGVGARTAERLVLELREKVASG
jgi:Holliday junction DNA helicase RuvA